MNNKIVLVAVVTLLTAFSAFARREDSRHARNRTNIDRKEWMAKADRPGARYDKLFTEEQKASIKEIKVKSRKEVKPLQYKLKELEARQRTLINEDKPDIKGINSNIDDITKVKNQLAKIKAKTRVEVLSQLTDEQKMLFSERKHMKGKRQNPRRAYWGF